MDYKINNYPIEAVLPHDHPMILIDSLEKYSEDIGCCQVTITTTSNFFDPKLESIPSYVGIEYMAQAIAAYANAHEKDLGHTVAIGFLVSSRKFKLYTPQYSLGAVLKVTVEKLYKDDSGLSAFECKIEQNGELLSEAKINVFQPDDPDQFLAEQ